MYYIGIDLGTSAVKLLLMEESGKICNIVCSEHGGNEGADKGY